MDRRGFLGRVLALGVAPRLESGGRSEAIHTVRLHGADDYERAIRSRWMRPSEVRELEEIQDEHDG